MLAKPQPPPIPPPKSWPGCVKSAAVHAIALAHYSIVYARAWAADSINARVRLVAEKERFYEEWIQTRNGTRSPIALVCGLGCSFSDTISKLMP